MRTLKIEVLAMAPAWAKFMRGAFGVSRESAHWWIELDADDATTYAVLAADERWNGYSISDLAPPYRAYAQFAVASREAQAPSAACLLLRHPAFTALIPTGDPDGVEAILAAAKLPERTYVTAQAAHLSAQERHFTFVEGPEAMLRMAVTAATFRPRTGYAELVVRLGRADLAQAHELYEGPEGKRLAQFHDDLLTLGPFYGVRVGGALVAAGGTHTVSIRHGIAAIGNILTLPAHRGHGYASAVPAAMVAELLANGCRTVLLNVVEQNQVAERLYARLGFHTHCQYQEGTAQRHMTIDSDTPFLLSDPAWPEPLACISVPWTGRRDRETMGNRWM
jgi:GNAT superfamily N-acetyltransferase